MSKGSPQIEEIRKNIYKIDIPIPENPLKALNSYVIKGRERNLIIDTGVNRIEAVEATFSGLRKLNVDLNKTDLFSTHFHVDHMGLVKKFDTNSSKFFFNKQEAPSVNCDKHWQAVYSWQDVYRCRLNHGFPENKLEETIRAYPGYDYAAGNDANVIILGEGDEITVEDYSLRCIETPGHTLGHMCLYESANKLLFSGDHLLFDVTPNVGQMIEDEKPLESYLASLEKLIPLEVDLVLPGHKRIFTDHRKRIRELQKHHEDRLNEILFILEKGEKNAYQIVPQVNWSTESKCWDDLPFLHKFASFGETISHLTYLESKGRVLRSKKKGRIAFCLSGNGEV